MIKHVALVAFVASQIVTSVVDASLPIFTSNSDENQCWGIKIDFDRIRQVSKDDIDTTSSTGRAFLGDDRMYAFDTEISVNQKGSSNCLFKRLRMQEKKEGVEVFGADIVVTVADCSQETAHAFGYGDDGTHADVNLADVPLQVVADLDGKTYTNIEAQDGYVPTLSANQTAGIIADFYGILPEKVGQLTLNIFPSTEGDKLVYAGNAWVQKNDDDQFFNVIVSALTGEFLSVCKGSSAHHERIKRLRGENLRSQQEERNLMNCQSCADQSASITWTKTEVACDVHTLYLSNSGLQTICNVGTTSTGEQVLGPGEVDHLHWEGTYDCNSKQRGCSAVALPTCEDALSDVQFNIVQTLEFYQNYLGIMGGLSADAGNPVPSRAYVHYSSKYCNAFFTTQTNALYFGDCDCSTWTPLASMDVVAHELSHGITAFSSKLIYQYQAGGLNEAYSDVVGATMEFVVNDSKDKPDFDVGENLGGAILRYMETPGKDTKSLESACDYADDINVHYTSGVLNKAFVKSIRACQNSGCGGERDCTLLMGPLFMYANIHRLTSLSGYLDSAHHTCSVVDEFFSTRNPSTSCTRVQTTSFVKAGFNSVGISIDDSCAATTPSCSLPGTPPGAGGAAGCFSRLMDNLSNLRPKNWAILKSLGLFN